MMPLLWNRNMLIHVTFIQLFSLLIFLLLIKKNYIFKQMCFFLVLLFFLAK